jgi:hypothetical protein
MAEQDRFGSTEQMNTAVFSGAVRCDTLIANSIVAARHSPGVGNVM